METMTDQETARLLARVERLEAELQAAQAENQRLQVEVARRDGELAALRKMAERPASPVVVRETVPVPVAAPAPRRETTHPGWPVRRDYDVWVKVDPRSTATCMTTSLGSGGSNQRRMA